MAETTKRQRAIIDKLKGMSNALLFEEMLEAQEPDDYDGMFTSTASVYREATVLAVKERLGEWLQK